MRVAQRWVRPGTRPACLEGHEVVRERRERRAVDRLDRHIAPQQVLRRAQLELRRRLGLVLGRAAEHVQLLLRQDDQRLLARRSPAAEVDALDAVGEDDVRVGVPPEHLARHLEVLPPHPEPLERALDRLPPPLLRARERGVRLGAQLDKVPPGDVPPPAALDLADGPLDLGLAQALEREERVGLADEDLRAAELHLARTKLQRLLHIGDDCLARLEVGAAELLRTRPAVTAVTCGSSRPLRLRTCGNVFLDSSLKRARKRSSSWR
jgi:hypothetical protein